MKTVHFLRFFTLKENNFYIFLSILDIIWFTFHLIMGYYTYELFRAPIISTSLLFIDVIMLVLTIFCLLYFLAMKNYQSVFHKFFTWTRFLCYSGFIILFIGIMVFSIFNNSNFEDDTQKKAIYITLFALALPFCFFNAYWCLSLNKIINDSIDNKEKEEDSKPSSLYTDESSGKEV